MPTEAIAAVLFAAVAILAAHRRDWTLFLDALAVALYARFPAPWTLALVFVQALIRRVPTLAQQLMSVFGIDAAQGWTAAVLLFVLPGLRVYQSVAHPAPEAATGKTAMLPPLAQPEPPAPVVRQIAPVPAGSWWPLVNDRPDTHPHALILGPSGQGKSWQLEALARSRDGQLLVIQPNARAADWQGISVVQCDDAGSFVPIVGAIEWIRNEFKRRGGAMRQGDPGPWLTIVWDELLLCNSQLGDLSRQTIVQLITAGRPRKMRLLGGSNSERVAALGLDGVGDLSFSCAIIRIGSFAVAKVPALEAIQWPASLEIDGKAPMAVDRSAVPQLLRMPVAPGRVIDLASASRPTEAPIPQIAPASVSDRPDADVDARQQRIERYAGMRAMGYERDTARAKLKAEGATLDNNEWAEAGELLKQRMGAAAKARGSKQVASV